MWIPPRCWNSQNYRQRMYIGCLRKDTRKALFYVFFHCHLRDKFVFFGSNSKYVREEQVKAQRPYSKSLQHQKSFTSISHFNPLFQHQTLTSASISDPFMGEDPSPHLISLSLSLSTFHTHEDTSGYWKEACFCKRTTSVVFFFNVTVHWLSQHGPNAV